MEKRERAPLVDSENKSIEKFGKFIKNLDIFGISVQWTVSG